MGGGASKAQAVNADAGGAGGSSIDQEPIPVSALPSSLPNVSAKYADHDADARQENNNNTDKRASPEHEPSPNQDKDNNLYISVPASPIPEDGVSEAEPSSFSSPNPFVLKKNKSSSAMTPVFTPTNGGASRPTSSSTVTPGSSRMLQENMDDALSSAKLAQTTVDLLFEFIPFCNGDDRETSDLVIQTITNESFHVESRNADGNTLLIFAAMYRNDEIVKTLLNAIGADPNAQNSSGSCALHFACYADTPYSIEMARTLLENGASPNIAESHYGCTPLHYAVCTDNKDLVRLLFKHGALASKVDLEGYSVLGWAQEYSSSEMCCLVQQEFDMEAIDMSNAKKLPEKPGNRVDSFLSMHKSTKTMSPASLELHMWQQEVEHGFIPSEESKISDEIRAQNNVLNGQIKELRLQLAGEREARENAEQKVKECETQIAEQAHMKDQSNTQNAEAMASLDAFKSSHKAEIEQLKANHASSMDAVIEEHSEQIKRVAAESAQLKLLLEQVREENITKMEQKKSQAARELEEANRSRSQAIGYASQLKKVTAELEIALMKISQSEIQRKQLEAELTAARLLAAERENARAKLSPLKREVAHQRQMFEEKLQKAQTGNDRALQEKEHFEQMYREAEKAQEEFKTKFLQSEQECLKLDAQRRTYFNKYEDLRGKIRVYCRIRPLSNSEKSRGCTNAVELDSDGDGCCSVFVQTARGRKRFNFDVAFGPTSTQKQVFEDTKNLMQSAIDGYNVCIFAYGQTGSGKTYTMSGPEGASMEMQGITPRAIKTLFSIMERDREKYEFTVQMYMLELYKNDLTDLLGSVSKEKMKLKIKKGANGIVMVDGANLRSVTAEEQIYEYMREGIEKRHTACTLMNSESSRSHLITSIIVTSKNIKSNVTLVGKLTLVDLAGSERVGKTGASGDTLKEAMSINKSLSALGDVISALSTGKKHIPYRNHQLTMLMSDSLGGNAKTLMFVNVSPADYNAAETANALGFATRCKNVDQKANTSQSTKTVRSLQDKLAEIKEAHGGDIPPTPTLQRSPSKMRRKRGKRGPR